MVLAGERLKSGQFSIWDKLHFCCSIRSELACVTITLPERKKKERDLSDFFSFRDGGCNTGYSELKNKECFEGGFRTNFPLEGRYPNILARSFAFDEF